MEIFSTWAAILLTLSLSLSALEQIGFENLLAGIITFVVGIWMLSFGLLLRFNHTPGAHPMRINGYILVILGIFSTVSNLVVIAAGLGTQPASSTLLEYGIPSIIGLILSVVVVFLAYQYMVRYKNFKRRIGTYVIIIGLILALSSMVNLYYYYLFLQLQYYLVLHPGLG